MLGDVKELKSNNLAAVEEVEVLVRRLFDTDLLFKDFR
jgi:hypothetical protein